MRYRYRLLLAAIITALGLAIPPPAQAAYVITLDVPAGFDQATADGVADMWTKAGVLGVAVGDCDLGPRCIKVSVTGCPALVGLQCAAGYFTGSFGEGCSVQVSTEANIYSDALRHNALGHEVGHCLELPHNDNPRSIMYARVDKDDREKRPDRTDKELLKLVSP